MFEFTVKAHRPKTNAADVKSEVVPIKASVTVKFGAGKENPTPYNGAETHCVSTNTLPAKTFELESMVCQTLINSDPLSFC